MNRDNLTQLANYLAALPADYQAFEMDVFFEELKARSLRQTDFRNPAWHTARDASAVLEKRYAQENGGVGKCGAVACAIGHGPSAGFLATIEDFTLWGSMDWGKYQTRVFGIRDEADWSWCFGGDWHYVDNTPQGAAKRIRYLVDNGSAPANFDHDYAEGYADFVPLYQEY